MKMILAFLLMALLVPSILTSAQSQKSVGQSGWSANVRSEPKHEGLCSVGLPLDRPSMLGVTTAPNCGIYVAGLTERWADPKVPPSAQTGGLVSGFRFNGWMENGKAKVMVWALVNDKDSMSASYDEKKLTGQLVDTFLLEPGGSVVVNELRRYGAKPIELSITRTK
ncbi:MAG: hypothetical protein ACXW1R_07270 [Halobacteriota archaeon]